MNSSKLLRTTDFMAWFARWVTWLQKQEDPKNFDTKENLVLIVTVSKKEWENYLETMKKALKDPEKSKKIKDISEKLYKSQKENIK